jgi:hypothetical protein
MVSKKQKRAEQPSSLADIFADEKLRLALLAAVAPVVTNRLGGKRSKGARLLAGTLKAAVAAQGMKVAAGQTKKAAHNKVGSAGSGLRSVGEKAAEKATGHVRTLRGEIIAVRDELRDLAQEGRTRLEESVRGGSADSETREE